MASTEAHEQETCRESTGRTGTSIVLDSEWRDLKLIGIKSSRKITLLQEPKETSILDYLIAPTNTYSCSCCGAQSEDGTTGSCHAGYYKNVSSTSYKHFLKLTFDNYLHETSPDYCYEIEIRALIDTGNNFHQHVVLYTHKGIRTKSEISSEVPITQQPLYNLSAIPNCSIIHVCANVVRFSMNESTGEQESFKSSVKDFAHSLLQDGFYSDVSLVVGDKIFPAHKHILSSQSEVFKAMFTHEMKEKEEGEIKIEEFDAEVIEEMLHYVYTNEMKVVDKIPLEVYKPADKYAIEGLKSECLKYFIFNLNFHNVIDILDLATLYDLEDLKSRAMAFVTSHEEEMAKEDSFQKFLCRNLNANTIAYALKLCAKYNMKILKSAAFDFVQKHHEDVNTNKEFLELFESHPLLQRDIYLYVCSKMIKMKTSDV